MRRVLLLSAVLLAAPVAAQSHDHGSADAPAKIVAPKGGWAADQAYAPNAMTKARAGMIAEHGGMTFSQLMVNIAEIGMRKGRDGYRWDLEYWRGGDIDRLTIKSEGEGDFGRSSDGAEVQALWSHALDAYWNLQAGGRYDIRPMPGRGYATIGIEGLSPYWFEVEAALFLSTKGKLLGRVEAWYDQRLTQRLVLQPRIEANLSAQDDPARGRGTGLTDAEAGLRLRYELRREFAPYIGLSYQRRFDDTARAARASGVKAASTSLGAGIRFWF